MINKFLSTLQSFVHTSARTIIDGKGHTPVILGPTPRSILESDNNFRLSPPKGVDEFDKKDSSLGTPQIFPVLSAEDFHLEMASFALFLLRTINCVCNVKRQSKTGFIEP